jgi:SNF2 family DNA or RNA helicase
VSWLINMHERGTNCILADEMGLGKTLQTITFLSYIKFHLKINGPSLVVVPLSVLTSWKNEFKKWAPTLNVIQLHSSGKKFTKLSGGIFFKHYSGNMNKILKRYPNIFSPSYILFFRYT